jgi:hypothetical protein
MDEIAVRHFQQRARAYVRSTGRFDEDVLSEMVCEFLQGKTEGMALPYIYLHALDRVHPRTTVHGERQRCREIPSALPETAVAPVRPETVRVPFATGSLRAMLLLRLVYGLREAELGQLFGVTESRISQLLGQGRAEVLAGLRPEREVVFDVPVLEVTWLTL